MIVYANGKVLGTDQDGNTQPIAAQGVDSDELKMSDFESRDYLQAMVKQLKILNFHMMLLTETAVKEEDVGE